MSNTDTRMYDKFYATLILNLLTKPFERQKAFSLGLIDKDGKQIKKPNTEDEKNAYTPLHEVTFGVKRLIDSFPGAKNGLKQLAVSLNFIRQQVVPKQFTESVNVDYNRFLKEFLLVIENDLVLVEEEILVQRHLSEENAGGEGGNSSSPSTDSVPDNSTENIDIHTPVIKRMFKKKVDENGGD